MAKAATLDEFGLIARYFAPLSEAEPGAFGLTDDAAVFSPAPGFELVVTMDTLVEGVHFLEESDPYDLARKALAVNLSDLASSGARARAYTLSVSLTAATDEAWLEKFARGLAAMQQAHEITLIGGDTVKAPHLSLTVTAFGEVEHGQALRRSGAKHGDVVYLSGPIGAGALGLLQARGSLDGDAFVSHYLAPTPRLDLGRALIGKASACADVSDGLLADLGHICTASGVGAELHMELLPVLGPAETFSHAVSGGDDYELVFTAPPHLDLSRLGVFEIGRIVTHRADVAVVDRLGAEIAFPRMGYQHFGD